ncbi:germin-like protein subfamily T member 2 [Papaver somniferum]|uniref:germin-like protein subfamily T member 2 n=1 Tax=Papaver somniferum TaxID=3469 RepID=UPI000E6F8064|nr:germin-like protein subfamily T member 2 [Papaver somniferum]
MAAAKFSIKTTSSFFLVLCLSTIIFFTLSCFSSDPDPLQDFCVADLKSTTTVVNGFPCKPVSQVTSNDFFYSGLMNGSSTANPLGIGISPADVNNFPGVNTLGLAAARVDFAAGGYIPLHSHPRASEIIYIISGEIHIGFVSTTNVFYSKVLKSGELSIIPRGLVHSVSNAGQGKAVMIATFNSQQPGFAQIPSNLFASNPTIPNEILAKNFQVDVNVIAIIKSKFGNLIN